MKISKILNSIGLLLIGTLFTQCELDEIPKDALTSEQITTTSDGLPSLVNGLYAIFMQTDNNNGYIRQYY
ncbi:MAG: RagB/SusD family nutrient uptake outer membrane protein, partial [Omnitrophica WOR_2 bacterium]